MNWSTTLSSKAARDWARQLEFKRGWHRIQNVAANVSNHYEHNYLGQKRPAESPPDIVRTTSGNTVTCYAYWTGKRFSQVWVPGNSKPNKVSISGRI